MAERLKQFPPDEPVDPKEWPITAKEVSEIALIDPEEAAHLAQKQGPSD